MDNDRLFQHKIAAARRAHQIMRDPNVVFLDSETTGLDGARFVELAVINRKGKTLLQERLDPMDKITTKAMEIHHILPWMLVGQPRFFEIYPDLAKTLAGKRLVIYNAQFDFAVLTSEMTRAGFNPEYRAHLGPIELLQLRGLHCAMFLYAQFSGEYSDYHGSFTWQKLVNAAEELQVQVEAPAHSAVGECLRTLGVMRGMARWYERFSSHYQELVS
jgi:DNA polymerase-3 subunit epsilon